MPMRRWLWILPLLLASVAFAESPAMDEGQGGLRQLPPRKHIGGKINTEAKTLRDYRAQPVQQEY